MGEALRDAIMPKYGEALAVEPMPEMAASIVVVFMVAVCRCGCGKFDGDVGLK